MVCKYFRVFLNSMKEKFTFKFDLILMVLERLFDLLIMGMIWSFFGYKRAMEYFAMIILLKTLESSRGVLRKMDDWVRSGAFTMGLSLPISQELKVLFYVFGRRILRFLVFLPFVLPFLSIKKLIILFPFILLSKLLSFFIALSFSYFSFKYEGGNFFFYISFGILYDVLSGRYIPIDILRRFLGNIVDILPFKYTYGVVWELYSGNFSVIFPAVFWTLFFFILAKLSFGKGLREYRAYGG